MIHCRLLVVVNIPTRELATVWTYHQPLQLEHMVHFQTSDSPWQTPPKGLAVKVDPRYEIGRLSLIGRVGGTREGTAHLSGKGAERLIFYCRTTNASTAPRTPRKTCCPHAYVLVTVLRVPAKVTPPTP